MEGKYRPQNLGQKEYNELGTTLILMLRTCRPIFGLGKAVILDSKCFVAKGIIDLEAKGVYAGDLIKNQRYWTKRVHGELIDNKVEDKEFDDVGILEARTQDIRLFQIFCIKELYYAMNMMASWTKLDELEGEKTKRYLIEISGTK